MAPPSIHPNGEAVEWKYEAGLIEDNAAGIHQRAGLLALLSVVLRFYPPSGSRDNACMALSGARLAAGHAPDHAKSCVEAVAKAAGDEETRKRASAAKLDQPPRGRRRANP